MGCICSTDTFNGCDSFCPETGEEIIYVDKRYVSLLNLHGRDNFKYVEY